ncbi:hypothetical protein H5410_019974 [Solanum commersonii]|uniref:Uncharacterized protein n=1 Tax=Solanum commersonii TaxID=4109 RepID=A0A9J5Z8U8_SOLCO|nr:hypothetical protein H5410_019974 [Solanum commersonii]
MLLLDGCFVVEFIREYCEVKEKEDDIIKLAWMRNQVRRDMLLLENQLPFSVLVRLYHMTPRPNEENLLCMVRRTLLDIFPKVKVISQSEIQGITERFDHLLDVVHIFCRPSGKKVEQNMNASTQNQCCKISFCGNSLQLSKEIPESLDFWQCYHIPTAKEIFDAGVSFLKIGSVEENDEDKASLFDITFEKGLMKIPCFAIEDTMETFMRNMIAFEQHTSKKLYPYFSNYAHLMTQLIGSHRDANFLRQNKIILKDIGDDKKVANIFKKLSDGVDVAIENFYYIEECSKLTQHCEKPWNQMKASLRHNYFSSPWVGALTMAVITLLVLTIEEGSEVDYSIDIEETNNGEDPLGSQTKKSLNERIKNLNKSSNKIFTTIFKVTVGLSESNPDAYKPKLLSIGPYHKHDSKLGSMEKYKLCYLQRFLKRKGGIHDVESCISEMDKLKDDALKCYDDIGRIDMSIVANFSEMLLLDGCFVVEYIREHCEFIPPDCESISIEEDRIIKRLFMDYLIDSDKDVSLLRMNGIIVNKIGEDKEVASFFNKIGKGIAVSDDFYYEEECKKAVKHCEQSWNRMKANLRHNYFNSPWAGISTVAAIILLLLTATQTVTGLLD